MVFAKFENGNVVPAPNPVVYNGKVCYYSGMPQHIAEILTGMGYKAVEYEPYPEVEEGEENLKYYIAVPFEEDNRIVYKWVEETPPEEPINRTIEQRIEELEADMTALNNAVQEGLNI